MNQSLQINAIGKRTAVPRFKRIGRPFSFTVNSHNLQDGWTPTKLGQHGIRSFGKLSHVKIFVTTENFEHVLMLVEAWLEANVSIHIRFPRLTSRPVVGTSADPTFAGLDTEECYICRSGGGFCTSSSLKQAFAETFKDDTRVRVQQ